MGALVSYGIARAATRFALRFLHTSFSFGLLRAALDLDPLLELGRQYDIPVVQDAAHALGTSYRGRPIGGLRN